MAGRPALRIGQHGKITRVPVDAGVWVARCRYRDTDGVTRIVERRSPVADQYGKKAEDALLEALVNRQAPGGGDITLDTKIVALIDAHITRIEEDGRAVRTIDTYRYNLEKFTKIVGGVRVSEANPPRIDAALRSMQNAHGTVMARQAKTLLRGGLQLAVMAGVLPSNPVRDVLRNLSTKQTVKGATPLDAQQYGALLEKLRASTECIERDLVDPMTMLMATGLRRSELLALRWSDYDSKAGIVTVTGKLIRAKGKSLSRVDETKTVAGARTLVLPPFAVAMLDARKKSDHYLTDCEAIFPSTAGRWRDPENFNTHWREVRDGLGLPSITTHSFRKAVATLIDEGGLSARVGADHLGHARVSMTQDVYMARKRVHPQVAAALEKAAISGG